MEKILLTKHFIKKVNAIAHELLKETKPQQKAAISTNNDIETYASIIAVWLTGNNYIPLNFDKKNNKFTSIIKTIKPDLLLN